MPLSAPLVATLDRMSLPLASDVLLRVLAERQASQWLPPWAGQTMAT